MECLPSLLDVVECSALCRVSVAHFRKMVESGLAPRPVEFGGVWRWSRGVMGRFLDSGVVEGSGLGVLPVGSTCDLRLPEVEVEVAPASYGAIVLKPQEPPLETVCQTGGECVSEKWANKTIEYRNVDRAEL